MLTRVWASASGAEDLAEEDPRQDPASRHRYSRLELEFVKNYFESEVRLLWKP